MANATPEEIRSNVVSILDEIFGPGDHFAPDPTYRGVRLKIAPAGGLTLAHPSADGPYILKVQRVPANVSDAEVLRDMRFVTVLRRDRTLAYGEIKRGAILR